MRRRAFMLLLGGAAVAAPLRGVAAQNDPVRRIAVLMPFDEGDPEGRHRLEVLREALRQLGWSDGRNLRIDVRWLAGDPAASARDRAAELVRLKPEVVLTASTPAVAAMSRATSTIPIVFAYVADPVGSGFVASLARPGGNVTGFANFDPAMASKWLELLKELAPATSRVLLLYNPETSPGGGVYFQPMAPRCSRLIDARQVMSIVSCAAPIRASCRSSSRRPSSWSSTSRRQKRLARHPARAVGPYRRGDRMKRRDIETALAPGFAHLLHAFPGAAIHRPRPLETASDAASPSGHAGYGRFQ
jgi:ABC transporter substrate binding protein